MNRTLTFSPTERRMIELAKTFPTFPRRPEVVDPWRPRELAAWAAASSHGELLVAQFLLAVWDPSHDWACGRFDVMEALSIWDAPHRDAFLAWAAEPWWP